MRSRAPKSEVEAAQHLWGPLPALSLRYLKRLLREYSLSVLAGDLIRLDARWYITHSGLLGVAQRKGCIGVRVRPITAFCNAQERRWAFRAEVYKNANCRGFAGYGDADPSNVSSLVLGAEMRVAETRAVNRALRKAYGIGLCSAEELGAPPPPKPPGRVRQTVASGPVPAQQPASGNGNGQPLLRDRLCQLIRQHRLDSEQVKRYAADFCGTQALREASRELVEDFVKQLAEWAARYRDGLVCHLNRYAKSAESAEPKEVAS